MVFLITNEVRHRKAPKEDSMVSAILPSSTGENC